MFILWQEKDSSQKVVIKDMMGNYQKENNVKVKVF